jgi:cysteine desulfurase
MRERKMKKIYLDNAATTKVDEKVLKAISPYHIEKYGNPSSQHLLGQEVKRALEQNRDIIARAINASSEEIIFTSGGTEANNLALKGLFFKNKSSGKNHIITTKIEHDCILKACKWLETQGAEVTYLNVDKEGFINLDALNSLITKNTFVVSVIHANNEIGTIQDIEKIGKICKKKNVLFHTDACQSFTKTNIDVKKQNIDMVTLNAHKIHGPKGIGALYIKKDIQKLITPLLHGGGHERNLRSGTENIPGIVGFAKAVKIAKKSYIKNMEKLRDKMIKEILKIPSTKLNGPSPESGKRICNNINISFKNIEGEAIGGYLDAYGICSSTGSACSSHTLEPSHVLLALGVSPLEANSSIRLSLSKDNTEQEIDYVLKILPKIVKKLRKISPISI